MSSWFPACDRLGPVLPRLGQRRWTIVKFEIQEQGPETRLILDHTGFPEASAESLRTGRHETLLGAAQEILRLTLADFEISRFRFVGGHPLEWLRAVSP
jgi:hypothetical protein